jgi:2-polyprenyl-3-methyl-5-hydroxy-6-metoxy-1,4-benzoquinol methylase
MTQVITEEYRALNEQLHATSERYGTSGQSYRELVRPIADWGRKPILDYGCGKGTLKSSLGPAYTVYQYDPAVVDYSQSPEPCETVVCTDVLEHIEPDLLGNVLDDLRRVTTGKAFIAVALVASSATLADGRNAHLSLHSVDEWKSMLEKHGFSIVDEKPAYRTVNLYWIIVE